MMTFRGNWSQKLGTKHLEAMERWARMEMFHVAGADEVLVDEPVPAASSSRPAYPTESPSPAAMRPSASTEPLKPRILGVAVEPLKARPGSEVGLVVTYALESGSAKGTTDILERRVILSDGRVLTTLESTVSRSAGTHRSRQALQIPAGVAPGVYELRVTVVGADASADGETIFQVVSDDD